MLPTTNSPTDGACTPPIATSPWASEPPAARTSRLRATGRDSRQTGSGGKRAIGDSHSVVVFNTAASISVALDAGPPLLTNKPCAEEWRPRSQRACRGERRRSRRRRPLGPAGDLHAWPLPATTAADTKEGVAAAINSWLGSFTRHPLERGANSSAQGFCHSGGPLERDEKIDARMNTTTGVAVAKWSLSPLPADGESLGQLLAGDIFWPRRPDAQGDVAIGGGCRHHHGLLVVGNITRRAPNQRAARPTATSSP